ncbi:SirB2 family protein [Kineobactrum salinum]|uniref:SirB2 family protein n=2 Tax=Kineobactrum salinum TaxID=2708301 RepID=A0A6C0U9A3_9GAMM|nr:SirB2 family protein [Kineobactrum salinum]
MLDLYSEVRAVHITAVFISGGLFAARGMGLILGGNWPLSAPMRRFSQVVDTILLIAALILTTLVHQYPFVHGWLTTKVVLLVVYIALGIIAFRPGWSPAVRCGYWLSALLVYGFIVSVARARHPLGVFANFG